MFPGVQRNLREFLYFFALIFAFQTCIFENSILPLMYREDIEEACTERTGRGSGGMREEAAWWGVVCTTRKLMRGACTMYITQKSLGKEGQSTHLQFTLYIEE